MHYFFCTPCILEVDGVFSNDWSKWHVTITWYVDDMFCVLLGLAAGCQQDIVSQFIQNENLSDLWRQSHAVWCRSQLHESQVITRQLFD